jgi:hypothetical protein
MRSVSVFLYCLEAELKIQLAASSGLACSFRDKFDDHTFFA